MKLSGIKIDQSAAAIQWILEVPPLGGRIVVFIQYRVSDTAAETS